MFSSTNHSSVQHLNNHDQVKWYCNRFSVCVFSLVERWWSYRSIRLPSLSGAHAFVSSAWARFRPLSVSTVKEHWRRWSPYRSVVHQSGWYKNRSVMYWLADYFSWGNLARIPDRWQWCIAGVWHNSWWSIVEDCSTRSWIDQPDECVQSHWWRRMAQPRCWSWMTK